MRHDRGVEQRGRFDRVFKREISAQEELARRRDRIGVHIEIAADALEVLGQDVFDAAVARREIAQRLLQEFEHLLLIQGHDALDDGLDAVLAADGEKAGDDPGIVRAKHLVEPANVRSRLWHHAPESI